MSRLLILAGCVVFAVAGCVDVSTVTSPSSVPISPPAPGPPPDPTPVPPPGPAQLSSVTMATAAAPGQARVVGTVTLTADAPADGAVVALESSNRDAAKVPSSVTVAAGATTATFVVDTATVVTRTTVTITATYGGVSGAVTLAVTLPPPRAVLAVFSPTRGLDVCALIRDGLALDCRLDGRASEGRLVRWFWTLEARGRLESARAEPVLNEIDANCSLVRGAAPLYDSRGIYVNMTVTLQVTDSDGTQSTASKSVKLYTNDNCDL